MTKIVDREAAVLRKVAKEVAQKDIGTPKLKKIIKDMNAALDSQDDGVAIAAPQIGVSLRIFIIKGSILHAERTKDKKLAVDEPEDQPRLPNIVFINPVIVKLSKKKAPMEEGCLSVRWLYGKVLRSEKATIRALDEYGKPFTSGASGLMAQAFQHECDHLDGILFIDKATDVEEMPPENIPAPTPKPHAKRAKAKR